MQFALRQRIALTANYSNAANAAWVKFVYFASFADKEVVDGELCKLYESCVNKFASFADGDVGNDE